MIIRREITEYCAREMDVYARDTENMLAHYYEPCGGLFIAESPKVIERALDAGCRPVSMLMESRHIEGEMKPVIARIEGSYPEEEIPLYTASLDIMMRITGYKLTRGALCAMRRPELPSPSDILSDISISRVAVLDNVENPTNVGAIFRSAAAMGIDAVLLTRDCSDPLYRRAVRVSMGTVFQIPWTYIDGVGPIFHEYGFRTAAMALTDDSVSIDDKALMSESRLAVILGNEGDGLKQETIDICDYTVKIPMYHGVDSLNVAAASAVAFWQLGNKKNFQIG